MEYLSVTQAAARLGISARQVARLIETGRLPALNVGTGQRRKDYRIAVADLDALRVQPAQGLPDEPKRRRHHRRTLPVEQLRF